MVCFPQNENTCKPVTASAAIFSGKVAGDHVLPGFNGNIRSFKLPGFNKVMKEQRDSSGNLNVLKNSAGPYEKRSTLDGMTCMKFGHAGMFSDIPVIKPDTTVMFYLLIKKIDKKW